ncbi:SagB family peptide dehydrogenase [Nocardiopsis metallicus]|uniref:SagB-type dehydrogenase family enzyme n=2 Tax=Nocardiopsis metallicus TaxID=179819 RepID=A0A840WQS8_9ACTN|nr:SagB family peptide dehydrogenase [Nocardiopsis metallicus]MBB5495351.1 SagB-type dehydrogenase family enzyme [Nocardiopsis metallicus]
MTRTHPNTTAVPVTGDGDAALVREYLYDVHYRWRAIHAQGQGGLDDPARPPLFTRPAEPRRRFPLPAGPRHRIGPLGAALREEPTTPVAGADRSGTGHGSDLERLGELLFYGYGFSRMDIGPQVEWPWHRTVASARCFYPVELAVWSDAAPAGVHRYDPAHHELSELREDVGPSELAAASAARFDGARAVLVVTARLGKTAFRYRNYAYRLATQEAGLVLGNLRVVASALGLGGHTRFRFLDEALARLLALPDDDSESVLALLPLWDRQNAPTEPGHRPAAPVPPRRTVVPVAGGNGIEPELSHRTLAVERASRLHEPADLEPVRAPASPPLAGAEPAAGSGTDLPLAPLRQESGTDTGAAVLRRDSGPDVFLPTAKPVPVGVVADILLDAVRPDADDLWHEAAPPEVGVHVIAGAVTGLPQGHYRYVDGALRTVSRADLRPPFQDMDVWRTEINARTAPLMLAVTADTARLLEHHPRRAFRATQLLTGVVAQRVSLAAAAHGLSARVTNSYDADECARLLGLDGEREIPVFLLVLGEPNAPWHLGMRVRP